LLLRDEIVFAKEAMIYLYSLRKTSRLLISAVFKTAGLCRKGIAVRTVSIQGNQVAVTGNRPTFLLKGNRPDFRRRGVRNGEIQLDLKPQSLLFLQPSRLFLKGDYMPTNEKHEQYIEDTPILLCSLADDVITDMLIAALKDNDIPVMKKSSGIGKNPAVSVVIGFSKQDVDIYVPSRLLEPAQEILSLITGGGESEENETEEEI